MNAVAPTTLTASALLHDEHPRAGFTARARALSWGAIFAGLAAALALEVVFMMLGAGLGFALYSPLTDENPIADFSKGALFIQGISAVLSLWFGGWVAGRFTPEGHRRTGWLHGFSVWASATVAGVLIVSAGAGWALGDLSKIVGGGLSLAGKPAAALTERAADAAKGAATRSSDLLASFTEEAVSGRPAGSTASTGVRAKREVGLTLARLFNPAATGNAAERRAAVVTALVDQAGFSPAEAEKTVTEWTASYERLKADLQAAKDQAEAKAREAADQAAKTMALFSLTYFAAFALGAAAATIGGLQGAKCALKSDQASALGLD